ncbi:unnamed protein product [Cylicocyclus nassatus]|uniref:Secreted protein n=1 Tax=Cylicocyclus nassatus TaxID=53992 RepID=A0AA36MDV7_CYLNA|nr:unnamed protein product [Cylicocyclus nassatus]
MRPLAVVLLTLSVLLLISVVDCKAPKETKNKDGNHDKQQKGKADAVKSKEKGKKVDKVKSVKFAESEKQEEPQLIKVREVLIEAGEIVGAPHNENTGHIHVGESLVDTLNHHQPKPIAKPKSLKVLNAYEQCKMECKRQRDSVHAREYVEQLKAELAAAEAALAAEIAAENAANAPAVEHADTTVDTSTHFSS